MIFDEIKNYRFPFWLAVFSLLLISIPVFIFSGAFIWAKVSGVILVCSLLIALKYWFAVAKNRNHIVPRVVLNKNDLFDLSRDFKTFSSFSEESKDVIIHRIGILLSKVKFVKSDFTLLDRRHSIQLGFVYTCEHWTDDFNVSPDWIFQLTEEYSSDDSKYKYVLSINDLNEKFKNIQISNM